MLIRTEKGGDYHEVYALIQGAFAKAEHSDGTEQDLVVALRKGEAFVPELSLVAENEGKILGHIMFTVGNINDRPILVLAPLSVLPGYQKQGIGTALINKGHQIAKKLGYQYAVVLGSEKYYPRLGYLPAAQFGIKAPFAVTPENFMAIKLQENPEPIQGMLKYPEEFGI